MGSHARDELGISETVAAHPIRATIISALTFALKATVPLIVALLVQAAQISVAVAASTLLAMAATAAVDALLGISVR